MLLLPLLLFFILSVWAVPQLVIENDGRKMIEVAEFGFLPGGQLTLQLTELNVSFSVYIYKIFYTIATY